MEETPRAGEMEESVNDLAYASTNRRRMGWKKRIAYGLAVGTTVLTLGTCDRVWESLDDSFSGAWDTYLSLPVKTGMHRDGVYGSLRIPGDGATHHYTVQGTYRLGTLEVDVRKASIPHSTNSLSSNTPVETWFNLKW